MAHPSPAARATFRVLAVALTVLAVLCPPAAQPATASVIGFDQPTSVFVKDHYWVGTNQQSIAVPGAGTFGTALPYGAQVPVSGLTGTVTDVAVTLNDLSHTWPSDLDVLLVGPAGQAAVLMSDAGGSTPMTAATLSLGDGYRTAVPDGPVVEDGYAPTDYGSPESWPAPAPPGTHQTDLNVFDGTDPNGAWRLYVTDDADNDSGTIASGWTLHLTVKPGTSPFPSSLSVSGTGEVTDLDVELHGIDHARVSDLDIVLVGPDGARVALLSDAGNDSSPSAFDVDVVIDDEAVTMAPEGSPLASGAYRPGALGPDDLESIGDAGIEYAADDLDVFDGRSADGTWQLLAYDDTAGVIGSITGGWGLRITTASDSEPATTTTQSPPAPTAPSTAASVDATPPRVAATSPPAGGRPGVRVDVTARLSEKIRPGTVTRRTAYLTRLGSTRHVGATVSWQPGTRTVVIDPARALRHGTRYRVVVTTAVKDLAGNRLDQRPARSGLQPKTWTFTTR